MTVKHINTADDLARAFSIRKHVFVEEQGVALKDEFDHYDQLTPAVQHLLVLDKGQAVGTARLRAVDGQGKFERICLLKQARGQGLGRDILIALEALAITRGLTRVKLHAQTHAEGFYQSLGYRTDSDVFDEDGLPHVRMVKTLS